MGTAEKVAEKIARKAAETCAPLKLEMELSKWAAEFRKIMWDAVAHHAEVLANEAAPEDHKDLPTYKEMRGILK